jgi:hypothetical protein
MHHYVYYSYEEWGRGYIGVRSCKCHPEEDCKYIGSYTDRTFKPTRKEVLEQFSSREDAIEAEILLHNFFEVHLNSHFANRSKQTSVGYDRKGVPISEEAKQKSRTSHKKFRLENPDLEILR